MNTYVIHTPEGEVVDVRYSARDPEDKGMQRDMRDAMVAASRARPRGERTLVWSARVGLHEPAQVVDLGARHPWDEEGDPEAAEYDPEAPVGTVPPLAPRWLAWQSWRASRKVRDGHVEGALCTAFIAGWIAAEGEGHRLEGELQSVSRRMDQVVLQLDERDVFDLANEAPLGGRRVVLTILPREEG